jgi:diacylglycerol O-acyltransferase
MRQMAAMDALWLHLDSVRTPNHMAMLGIYDPSTAPGGVVTFEQVLDYLGARVHIAPVFRQKLVRVPFDADYPYWTRDPDFDLAYHVRRAPLPKRRGRRALADHLADICIPTLDMSRPLWELYFVEELDGVADVPPGCFATILKAHHVAMDGASGVEVTNGLHTASPTEAPPVATEAWTPEEDPSSWSLLAGAAYHNVRAPLRLPGAALKAAPRLGRALSAVRRREIAAPEYGRPPTRFDGPVSNHRVVVWRKYALDDIKQIRAAVSGATINDAAVAVVAGALRRYLTAKGELPKESLSTAVHISVRDPAEKAEGGNEAWAMFIPLHTDVLDPLDRLAAVHESTSQGKSMVNAMGGRTMIELMRGVPGPVAVPAVKAGVERSYRRVNTIVTNVPGPRGPLYFCGAKWLGGPGASPLMEMCGLIHGISSYADDVWFSITSCRELLADPEFYGQCLDEAFDELKAATALHVAASR